MLQTAMASTRQALNGIKIQRLIQRSHARHFFSISQNKITTFLLTMEDETVDIDDKIC